MSAHGQEAGSSGCGGGGGGLGGGGATLGAGGAAVRIGSVALVLVAASAVASSVQFFDMQEELSGTGAVTLVCVCAKVVVMGSVVSVRAKSNNDN